MAHTVVFSCCSNAVPSRLPAATNIASSSSPWSRNGHHRQSVRPRSSGLCTGNSLFPAQGFQVWTGVTCNHHRRVHVKASAEAGPEVEVVRDEKWEKLMREQTAERAQQREKDEEEERAKEAGYRKITQELQSFPQEEVQQARKFIANLIKAGEKVEEMIEEAADNGELTPLVLLVIKNRLDLARHDDERAAMQALDLLYRRVETEIWCRQASPAFQLLNELLHLDDGSSREEWLRRSRNIMLQVFPPEDAFSILGGPGFDLANHKGPIEMPEEEDDVLLRVDFIREVDKFLSELRAQPEMTPMQGFDAPSIAVRLRQEERLRAIEQVKDLRNLAIKLQR